MKLAAIDIGSNSIHMIVARIDGEGSFDIIAREKEMVRLGERSLAEGVLGEDAQRRGLDTLANFRKIAEGYGVSEIIANATSAVRESRNGPDFIDRVRDEAGVDARIIEGVEEGRLIYLGVREVFDFGARRALIIDIGGGSVELVLADQRREYIVRSLKLGVRRLHDTFLHRDPPAKADLDALRAHVRATVAPVVEAVAHRGFDVVLGTSGTARALAKITATRTGGSETHVSRTELGRTVASLAKMTAEERAQAPGIDDKRRDAILEGAILMHTLLDAFGARGFDYCDAALREGMIIDYLERNRPGLRMAMNVADPRRRSVLQFARRLYDSTAHAEQVARIAVRLFDDLQQLHGLDPRWRELLEYGAYLHDIGRVVASSAHHKHTLYLIKHADLAGFTETEQLVVANIARYHRRSIPRSRHADWTALSVEDREGVVRASTLLRLAKALDFGRQGTVRGLDASFDSGHLRIAFDAFAPPDVELRALERKAHHIPRVFGVDLQVVIEPDRTPLWETP
jgi:exopolyphosphatase/guanosine-5'-triphosphate,3'-diphosphate pyrophosphatase